MLRSLLATTLIAITAISGLVLHSAASAQSPSASSTPASPPTNALTVIETEDSVAVRRGECLILEYRKTAPELPAGIDPVFRRSGFLHPVQTPSGFAVTAAYPEDHPHQQGIFSAWVSTEYDGREIDFWNLAKQLGRVRHESVLSIEEDGARPAFEVALIHEVLIPQPRDVLREVWKVSVVSATEAYHCFDIEFRQQALTDLPLLVRQYHYGGMAVRGPVAWLAPAKSRKEGAISLTNDQGSDRAAGNHQPAKWVHLKGPTDLGATDLGATDLGATDLGATASIVAMAHASNYRAPQAARLHPNKPYFCFSPCVDAAFTIDKQHEHVGKYRFFVADEVPSQAWLLEMYNAWHQE